MGEKILSAEEVKRIGAQCETLGSLYEELFSFLYDLRRADFRIGTRQFIAVEKLLVALARNGKDAVDFRRLATYLAPLVCSSPDEQTNFYQLFDQWLETHQSPAPLNEIIQPEIIEQQNAALNQAAGKKSNSQFRRQKPILIAASLAAIILAAIFAIRFFYPVTKTLAGSVVDAESQKPLGDAEITLGEETRKSNQEGRFSFEYRASSNNLPLTVSRAEYQPLTTFVEPSAESQAKFSLTRLTPTPTQTPPIVVKTETPISAEQQPAQPPAQTFPPPIYPQYYFFLLLAAALLPFLIYGLWNLWWFLRRRQLERWRENNQPDLKNLKLRKEENFLYRSPTFRRAAQELRRHRRVPTNALDIGYTVEATLREGGLFKPVFGKRQVSPEYLVLIDRLDFRDQKGQLEDKILDRLKKEGVFFECFYFNGDPRLCRQKTANRTGETTRFFNLQELAAYYPEHRLLVFSDGAGMVNRFSNRPHRWVKNLAEWESRALLTPNSALSYHEWILEQEAELPVLPAHEADLKSLVEIIRMGDFPKMKSYATSTDYPTTLLEDYDQWWARRVNPRGGETIEDEESGEADKVEMLCLELRYYLGEDGYFLLCACAVYPELSGDLTFYLAHRFIAPAEREATLEALVCLPWFRQGAMPDWLRAELLAELTFEQETKVREAIEQLLTDYLDNPQEGFSLEIATRKKADEEGLWKILRRRIADWRRRKFFRDIIKTELENSPLKDYIFLKFISGSKLAVAVPRKLSRFLQSQTETRFKFLRRFYDVCSNLFKSIGELWQKIYHKNLPINGISRRTGVLVPMFASVIAFTLILQIQPDFLPIGNNDLQIARSDIPEDNYLSKLLKAFATPEPIAMPEPVATTSPITTASPGITTSPITIASPAATISPNASETTTVSPTVTLTPTLPIGCKNGECCNTITATDGYLITYIGGANIEGSVGFNIGSQEPIKSKYIETKTIYSPEIAKSIGRDALPILSSKGLFSVASYCPQILTSDCPGGKCLSLYILGSPFLITNPEVTPTPKSTPMDTPSPTPQQSQITAVDVTFLTIENPKNVGDAVTVQVFLNGSVIGSTSVGVKERWEKGSQNSVRVKLDSPFSFDACKQLSLRVAKQPNQHQWTMQLLTVSGIIPSDNSVSLSNGRQSANQQSVSRGVTLKLGDEYPGETIINLNCPYVRTLSTKP